ncbi:MAG: nucleoside triphosphate hydrolase [Pseudomonadota bacterium]
MPTLIALSDLAARLAAMPVGHRHIVGLAGAPGSGKSTAADRLVARIEQIAPGRAAVLPMDGYHLDDGILVARGLRPRKGAPDTFDVPGFVHMLARLRANEEAEIAIPEFDRDLEIARAGARMIPKTVEILVVEGNYLLLDRPPWSALAGAFDLTVFVDVPEAERARRLMARWLDLGFSDAEARLKVEQNDMPNGRLITDESLPPDLTLDGTA